MKAFAVKMPTGEVAIESVSATEFAATAEYSTRRGTYWNRLVELGYTCVSVDLIEDECCTCEVAKGLNAGDIACAYPRCDAKQQGAGSEG